MILKNNLVMYTHSINTLRKFSLSFCFKINKFHMVFLLNMKFNYCYTKLITQFI